MTSSPHDYLNSTTTQSLNDAGVGGRTAAQLGSIEASCVSVPVSAPYYMPVSVPVAFFCLCLCTQCLYLSLYPSLYPVAVPTLCSRLAPVPVSYLNNASVWGRAASHSHHACGHVFLDGGASGTAIDAEALFSGTSSTHGSQHYTQHFSLYLSTAV